MRRRHFNPYGPPPGYRPRNPFDSGNEGPYWEVEDNMSWEAHFAGADLTNHVEGLITGYFISRVVKGGHMIVGIDSLWKFSW